jgi:MFS family permease
MHNGVPHRSRYEFFTYAFVIRSRLMSMSCRRRRRVLSWKDDAALNWFHEGLTVTIKTCGRCPHWCVNTCTPPAVETSVPPKYGVLVGFLTTVLLTAFVAATYGFGFYLFSQIVTDMRADLGFGYQLVGVITASGQLGFLVFALVGTWLAARLGGAQICVVSVLLCSVCLALVPVTDSVVFICVLLTIAGGTAASVYVPIVDIVGKVISYEHRGKVLGLISSGTSYGVFVNSLLVPSFVQNDNWRGLWYSVGSGTLMVALVAGYVFWKQGLFRRDPDQVDRARTRAMTNGPRRGLIGSPTAIRTILVRWVLLIWAMKFLNGFASMPYQNYLSPYLREDLGFNINFASNVWAAIGVIGMLSGFAIGWFSDHTGVRFSLLLCYSCFFVSTMLLVVAPVGFLPMLSGVLFAVAFYPIYGLVPAYVSKMSKSATAIIIFGVANVTQGVGGIVGNFLAGLLKNVTGSFRWFYIVIALGTVVLGVLTLMLPREGQEEIVPAATEPDPTPRLPEPVR